MVGRLVLKSVEQNEMDVMLGKLQAILESGSLASAWSMEPQAVQSPILGSIK